MIQRIQSFYMIFSSLSVLCVFIFGLKLEFFLSFTSAQYIKYLGLLSSAIIFANLFLYKRRLIQIKLNTIVLVLLVLIQAYLMIAIVTGENIEAGLLVFLLLPVASILLLFANKGIKKDEDLVRSIDRVR